MPKLETHLGALYSPEAVASEHAKLRDVLNLATDAEKRFRTGSKIDRGTLVRELGSNPTLTDKILSIKASKPFVRLQEILNQFRPER